MERVDGKDEGARHIYDVVHQLKNAVLAGATSGLSRLITHPTDTIKARMQVQGIISLRSSNYSSLLKAVRSIYNSEGLQGFYSGFGAVAIGIIPANAAYYFGHAVGQEVSGGGFLGDMVTGIIAQAFAGLVFTPIDVVKERLQVQRMMERGGQVTMGYKGAIQAFQSLYNEKQVLRGYWITNSVWFPWGMVYMSCYEGLKRNLASCDNKYELSALQFAICSGISATIAVIVTHPLDIIKTRYQVLVNEKTSNMKTIVQRMIQDEGVNVLHKGLLARILTIAPGSALSWMIYESMRALLNQPPNS
eukprot:TRINITY_DN2032_c0_g1_i9.p1 TRINITY_DN2032_c0_g1~~TRINITY_DN2032_c0_g1_i9.p1  ORF type:complete len:304 (+),score=26.41 TRINITY_DN2032_c0_g1_i9:285-1196(+)